MVYAVEDQRSSGELAAVERYRHPVLFYGLATAIPWVTWGIAGYLSHRPSQTTAVQGLTAILGVLGLLAPMLVAAALVWRDPALVRDVRERLLAIRDATLPRALLMLLLPMGALMLATAISLPLGYSPERLQCGRTASIAA